MRLGAYEVVQELARGGQGAVYRARRGDGREVAIKLLIAGGAAGEVQRKRFGREVEALLRLRHPHVVGLLDVGTHQGAPFLVMELVPGQTLEDRLRQGPLPEREAVALTRKLAQALHHAHEQNVLHRDVKPENVILDAEGEPWLTDFGLTRDVDPSLSRTQLSSEGRFMGTPGFLAPEQARGELGALSPRTDVFGLGALLYAALTARAPFAGENLLELLVRMESPPEPPRAIVRTVSRAVEAVCLRCLAYEPDDRYRSAGDLAWELGKLLEQGPRRSPPSRARVSAGLLALAGLALGLGLWWAQPGPYERAYEQVLHRREPEQALPQLTRLVEAQPDDGRLAALHGVALVLAHERQAAQAELQRALALDEDCALAHFGQAWLELSEPGGLEAIDRAIELDPDEPRFHELRAGIVLIRDDLPDPFGEALASLDRSLELDPDQEEVVERRASVLVWMEDYAGAVAGFSRLIELRPDDHEAYAQRAGVKLRAGDDPGALEDYSQCLRMDPTYDLGWLARADIRERTGDLAGAIADYERFLELDPDSPTVRETLAELRAALGEE